MELLNIIFEKQIYRFISVGILNAIISVGSYFILLDLNVYYLYSFLIAHIVGITNSFIWNRLWTFKSKGNLLIQYLKFNSVYVVTFIVNLMLLMFFVEKFMLNPKIAGVLALIVISIISFYGHKYWSFK